MLLQIAIAIQHIAFCAKAWITSCASCLLNIIFQRVGYVVVNHQSYVFLIYAHTKRRGSNNDAHAIVHEGFLVVCLFVGLHLSVERQCLETIASKSLGQLFCAFGARHIHNSRTRACRHQRAKLQILVIIVFGVYHAVH